MATDVALILSLNDVTPGNPLGGMAGILLLLDVKVSDILAHGGLALDYAILGPLLCLLSGIQGAIDWTVLFVTFGGLVLLLVSDLLILLLFF